MARSRGPAADQVPGASERARTSADTGPPDSPDPGDAEKGRARRDPPWWDTNDFALIVLAAVVGKAIYSMVNDASANLKVPEIGNGGGDGAP